LLGNGRVMRLQHSHDAFVSPLPARARAGTWTRKNKQRKANNQGQIDDGGGCVVARIRREANKEEAWRQVSVVT
jgi:hypothetical protein